MLPTPRSISISALLILPLLLPAAADDPAALLALKSALDRYHRLPWRPDTAPSLCSSWPGVRQCGPAPTGRVTKLVLENLNLTGSLTAALLAPLAELRVLSFKSNHLTGPIPDALPRNLKLLYLSGNRLQGRIPATLALLHRATVIVLSRNRLSGDIPAALATLPRLTSLLLDANLLTGAIPALPQHTLRLLNVSVNRLSGEIPAALARFNASSFLGNAGLCGAPLPTRCLVGAGPSPSPSPGPVTAALAAVPPARSKRRGGKKGGIVAGATVGGVAVVGILVAAAMAMMGRPGRSKRVAGDVDKGGGASATGQGGEEQRHCEGEAEAEAAEAVGTGREFSWEREGIGKLVFCSGGGGGEMYRYSLEELLRASAETLGRGEVGSTYKAVMETGFIVTVKRMREGGGGGEGMLGRRAEELGRLGHPNVVALRAYFQAKEERLLVYDYYPNGSLFSLLHGPRSSSRGKALHWTSCLKIAEDMAAGLVYLHQQGVVHANLKPSNVLLGPDFESCLTDYGLLPALLPSPSPASIDLPYRAPETRSASSFTAASDVYSFGVLLLELLTGRPPDPHLHLQAQDIPAWVRAVRDEDRDATTDSASAEEDTSSSKLSALVGIAAACVAPDPARRPATPEVLRMVREARAEAMSSSNSSDRSPARWSDPDAVPPPPPPPRDPVPAADSFT